MEDGLTNTEITIIKMANLMSHPLSRANLTQISSSIESKH